MKSFGLRATSALLLALIAPSLVRADDSDGGVISDAEFPYYSDAFADPNYILAKKFPETTTLAQASIKRWAVNMAAQGPWSVLNKTVPPPSNNEHDYLSWAPYWFPDCSNVKNTTELTPEQVWTQCNYIRKDGEFNPDRLLVNDTGHFFAMSDAVFGNALAWSFDPQPLYAKNIATMIDTWFVNPDTVMNPNLKYAQIRRGPGDQVGDHTGILDLKCMTKIASAVLVMRGANVPEWTPQLDTAFKNWTSVYMQWLESAPSALGEKAADNNHGSFYFTQLASLKIIVDDKAGAIETLKEYFGGIYQGQIDADGSQPKELTRTHPYHYTCYNLAAMITNAKLAQYAGWNAWGEKTAKGATIKNALDYALTLPPGKEQSGASELWPLVASVAVAYGDADGKYAAFLNEKQKNYAVEPFFFYEQPFSDSGYVAANPPPAGDTTNSGTKVQSSQPANAGVASFGVSAPVALVGTIVLLFFV